MSRPGAGVSDWKRSDALHHDREALRYDALIGREFAAYQRFWTADPWSELMSESGAHWVLDVGGGTGRTALPIAAAGSAVVIVDTSRGMLRRAREKAAGVTPGRLWLVVGDAERLPFSDRSFDGVVCQGVLHHLPDVTAALQEADRVLAAAGWLCLAEPDLHGSCLSRSVLRVIGALRPLAALLASRRSPAARHERPLDGRGLVGVLRAAGYAVTAGYLVHPPVVYRMLPPRAVVWLAWRLNRHPWSRRGGDMIVIQARKAVGEALVSPHPVR